MHCKTRLQIPLHQDEHWNQIYGDQTRTASFFLTIRTIRTRFSIIQAPIEESGIHIIRSLMLAPNVKTAFIPHHHAVQSIQTLPKPNMKTKSMHVRKVSYSRFKLPPFTKDFDWLTMCETGDSSETCPDRNRLWYCSSIIVGFLSRMTTFSFAILPNRFRFISLTSIFNYSKIREKDGCAGLRTRYVRLPTWKGASETNTFWGSWYRNRTAQSFLRSVK